MALLHSKKLGVSYIMLLWSLIVEGGWFNPVWNYNVSVIDVKFYFIQAQQYTVPMRSSYWPYG